MTQHRVRLTDLAMSGMLVAFLIAPAVMAREDAASVGTPAIQAAAGGGAQAPVVTSPEVGPDRRVTFRILAPDAQKVELRSPGDIPGIGGRGVAPPQLTRNADGVWEATEPVLKDPGSIYSQTP